MKQYAIKITLLSDLCSGSGDGVAGIVDNDATFDEYGLPYIPAKRIKGCIREAARELADVYGKKFNWNSYYNLFGIPGSNESGILSLDNAYLESYSSLVDELKLLQQHETYKDYFQPAHIKEYYTVTKAQTAIDKETGVAKENSLRVMRVVKKSNIFIANLLNSDIDTNSYNLLKKCCIVLRRMGLYRTRGLGEVKCELIDNSKSCLTTINENSIPQWESLNEGIYFLPYSLELLSQMIVENQIGHSQHTNTFIPGSTILGALASIYIKKNSIKEDAHNDPIFNSLFLTGEVKFLPAYITEDYTGQKIRCLPVPKTIVGKKDSTDIYDLAVQDKRDEINDGQIQTEIINGYCYISGRNIYFKNVECQLEHHHRRPYFRYYGHPAKENNNLINAGNHDQHDMGEFYHYTSINKGQDFKGYIVGSLELIKKLLEFIPSTQKIRLGRSKTAQYGQAFLTINTNNLINSDIGEKDGFTDFVETIGSNDYLVVTLTSPTILIDKSTGLVTPDPYILARMINETIKLASNDYGQLELKYSNVCNDIVSGYNRAWQLPRPQTVALGAGSVLVFKYIGKNELPVQVIQLPSYGIRQNEGFGRLVVNLHGNSGFGDILPILKPYLPDNDYNDNSMCKIMVSILKSNTLNRIKSELIGKPFSFAMMLNFKGKSNLNNTIEEFKKCSMSQIGRLAYIIKSSQDIVTIHNEINTIKNKPPQIVLNIINKISDANKENIFLNDILHQTKVWRDLNATGQKHTIENILVFNQFALLQHFLLALLNHTKWLKRRDKNMKECGISGQG